MFQSKMTKTVMTWVFGLGCLSASGLAQAYPDRPIKLIVPWAAGGDTDNIFRPFAPGLQKHLGQPVVIANVGGASGMKGAKEAKDAPADGYTLYAVHDYIHSAYYTGVGDVKYTDFEPICMISATPSVLTSSAKTAWKDWAGMLADAKARPVRLALVQRLAQQVISFLPWSKRQQASSSNMFLMTVLHRG
jgi:tripartite-type tricarboxylate transporter receptor subunit TctC